MSTRATSGDISAAIYTNPARQVRTVGRIAAVIAGIFYLIVGIAGLL